MATDRGDMAGTDLESAWRENPEQFQGTVESLSSLYNTSEEVVEDNLSLIQDTSDQLCDLRELGSEEVVTIFTTNSSETLEVQFVEQYDTGQNEIYEFTEVDSDRTIQIVIDYEGAYTSLVDVYVPYVTVLVVDGISLGDVETLTD